MFEGFDIWKLLAGLGIFLFGMYIMEESIKKLSGKSFRVLIRKYTTGKIKSILSGIFATSLLQSSSAVTLIILAFVGAGIMSMENAIGVILGSNIGTTITAWIVAFLGFKVSIESFALPIISIGGLGLIFLGNSEKYANISKLVVGFGFLFMGLDYMKVSMETFTKTLDITVLSDYGMFTYLGVGILLTAVMQSSSATIAIILTALNLKIISFDAAAAMVIGSNLGTTVTILLGAIKGIQVKKRVAFSHLVFNVVTGVIALVLMPVLIRLVLLMVDVTSNAVIGLALFHTIFNLLGVLLFLPFIKILATLLTRVFPDRKTSLTLYINNSTTDVAETAITTLLKETLHLAKKTLYHNLAILRIEQKLVFSNFEFISNHKAQNLSLAASYENLKLLQADIFTFAVGIQSNELTESESKDLNRYLHGARMALHSAKTLKDVGHNFDDFDNSDNKFLNEQYHNFRRRLMTTYVKLNTIIQGQESTDSTTLILKMIKELKLEDEAFLDNLTKAINDKQIENIDVSTAIIANRAFVQSERQVILAFKEFLLDEREIEIYDDVEEITGALSEH
ncbi:Na/Pi cotransporter family protein [Maribacter sp. ACAM166]|uniref:Na/Pi cotransporter family protein n=1 Tax=Maribacter sp. ACAM166 TaxID=2508996 RepID=UPI0010FEF73D|nr:Na/Pi symporter [Maribacter sp. ACAM166]TLP77272.1 Na/Pi cotransporter family protein [Maribacter sp. ACAM166]